MAGRRLQCRGLASGQDTAEPASPCGTGPCPSARSEVRPVPSGGTALRDGGGGSRRDPSLRGRRGSIRIPALFQEGSCLLPLPPGERKGDRPDLLIVSRVPLARPRSPSSHACPDAHTVSGTHPKGSLGWSHPPRGTDRLGGQEGRRWFPGGAGQARSCQLTGRHRQHRVMRNEDNVVCQSVRILAASFFPF